MTRLPGPLFVLPILTLLLVSCQDQHKEPKKEGLHAGTSDGPLLPGQTDGPKPEAPKKVEPKLDEQPKAGEVIDPPSSLFRPPVDESIKKAKKENPEDKEGLVVGRRDKIVLLYKWKEVSPGRFVIYCVRKDDTHLVHGVNVIFYAQTEGCKNAVWYQYVSEKLTFSDKNGKELASGHIDSNAALLSPDTDAPQVDLQLPYPFQTTGANPHMEDAAGFNESANPPPTADQAITASANKFKPGTGVPDATKLKSEKKYWTYLICLEPYRVIGHYEWGLTVTVDKNGKPQFSPEHEQEPDITWVADK